MKKYYPITTLAWLVITLLAFSLAVWNYMYIGWHNSWWYFITAGFSFFLFVARFRQWKKSGTK